MHLHRLEYLWKWKVKWKEKVWLEKLLVQRREQPREDSLIRVWGKFTGVDWAWSLFFRHTQDIIEPLLTQTWSQQLLLAVLR